MHSTLLVAAGRSVDTWFTPARFANRMRTLTKDVQDGNGKLIQFPDEIDLRTLSGKTAKEWGA